MTWRPRNETAEDRRRQNAARDMICAHRRCEAIDLSERLYEIDWMFHRGRRPICWAEYKHRDEQYDTVILGVAKWTRGCMLARRTNLPFLFMVEWPGHGLHWARLDKRAFPIEIGGNRRGQNGDIEPVIHVPIKNFKPL